MGDSTKELVGKFQDLNTYQSRNVYTMTNEDTNLHRELLKDKGPFARVAAICAGGEVGFFCLLPKVTRELVLIDHGYEAIGVAMVKHFLLKKYGASKARELFIAPEPHRYGDARTAEAKALQEKIDEAKNHLPKILRERALYLDSGFIHSGRRISSYLRREWTKYTPEILAQIEGKLDLITFIHGDFADLNRRRPFDLIYISNLLQHSGRNGTAKKSLIQTLVKPGEGLILRTDGPERDEAWVKTEFAGNSSLSWHHALYQIPKKTEAIAA